MKGLYSGRVIIARKVSKGSLTRTQTAGQAYTAIVKKYGEISQSAKYMHKGSGNWVKYSIENDRKRTGKTTTDIKKWREAPHKLDYVGKDTKPVKTGKKSFSVKSLKSPSKPTGRKAKGQPKTQRKAITKTISKPVQAKKKTKRVNRDKLSIAERAPEVKAPTGPKPATFDLKSNPDRKEFVSDYTGITDHLQRRANRVAKIRADQDKGRYKNADTRRHEANHAKYMKRGSKIRSSVKR